MNSGEKAGIVDGKIHLDNPNKLEAYVRDCLNDAVERLKDHNLVKENPLRYVIRLTLGLDHPHDPEWLPHARFAKENLADTETALKFITEHYQEFRKVVDDMMDNFGNDYYSIIFEKGFDLVRLTSYVYNDIVEQIAYDLQMLD